MRRRHGRAETCYAASESGNGLASNGGGASKDLPCKAQIEITGEAVANVRRSRYFTTVIVE